MAAVRLNLRREVSIITLAYPPAGLGEFTFTSVHLHHLSNFSINSKFPINSPSTSAAGIITNATLQNIDQLKVLIHLIVTLGRLQPLISGHQTKLAVPRRRLQHDPIRPIERVQLRNVRLALCLY